MMRPAFSRFVLKRLVAPALLIAAGSGVCFGLVGCGSSEPEELVLPDWLAESQAATPAPTGDTQLGQPAPFAAAGSSAPVATGSTFAASASPFVGSGSSTPSPVQLAVGQRTPLVRTIETVLSQDTGEAVASQHRTRLRVHFTLVVQAAEPGRSQVGVVFDRFELDRTIDGATSSGDTKRTDQPLPPVMNALASLVGRGFSYWVDDQNQIQQIDGKDALLAEAVSRVSAEDRDGVVKAFGSSTDLASLLDASIGLSSSQLTSGNQWTTGDGSLAPSRNYTVTEADATSARVSVIGSVPPQTSSAGDSVAVEIVGGALQGECVIDRATGLPKQAQSIETVDMTVRLADGRTFAQQRQTISSLAAQPIAAVAQTPSPAAVEAIPAAAAPFTTPPAAVTTPAPSAAATFGATPPAAVPVTPVSQPATSGVVQPPPYFQR